MRLGEKTTDNISEKFIERNRRLNAPKVYHIMIHLRTCPIDSHLCSNNVYPTNKCQTNHIIHASKSPQCIDM